jgi:hypothetical protein
MDAKMQVNELRTRLYAMRGELACEALLRLVAVELTMLDRRLRTCTEAELLHLQGQVHIWEKLQKYINEQPPPVKSLT